MQKSCAFTGHRVLAGKLDINLLDRVIENLIKTGVNKFYCGMAKGFDMLVAENVINFKKTYDISLYACIPFENQSEDYGEKDRERYSKILEECDGAIILSDEYYSGCMHARDRFMVDNCSVLVCYLRQNRGGTYYTVNYARKNCVKIIEL